MSNILSMISPVQNMLLAHNFHQNDCNLILIKRNIEKDLQGFSPIVYIYIIILLQIPSVSTHENAF